MEEILNELREMKKILLLASKEVLNVEDASILLGVSKDRIYHMVNSGDLPCYKRGNKSIFFKKSEIERWMLRGKKMSNEELEIEAMSYCHRHPLRLKKTK